MIRTFAEEYEVEWRAWTTPSGQPMFIANCGQGHGGADSLWAAVLLALQYSGGESGPATTGEIS